MTFPSTRKIWSLAAAISVSLAVIVAALALSPSTGSTASPTTKKVTATTKKSAAKTTAKKTVTKTTAKKSVATKKAVAASSGNTIVNTQLTWPVLKASRTYRVRVPVDATRSVDFYASSVSLGGKYSLSPGFQQTYSCAKGKTNAAVEFYEGTSSQITMELVVKNGGCTPVTGKTGAVPFQARITVRYLADEPSVDVPVVLDP